MEKNYTKRVVGAQGEITIIELVGATEADLPKMQTRTAERTAKGWIISHSESGHHHLLTGGDVMERTSDVPAGMQILYVILDKPASLIQDAAVPHGGYDLPAGIFEMRISREYDPFAEQARKVAD